MGKIKEKKFRFHQKTKNDSKTDLRMDVSQEITNTEPLPAPSNCSGNEDNIFAGININLSDITKTLPPSRAGSISSKSIKSRKEQIPKKEKIANRRAAFLQKLEMMYKVKKSVTKNKKKNKKREAKAVEDDNAPLLVATSDNEDDNSSQHKKKPQSIKSRPCMKAKHRQKADKADATYFKKVLNDPVFITNPSQTIAQWLKSSIAAKRPDLHPK